MTTEAKIKIKAKADVKNAISKVNAGFNGLKSTLKGVSIAGGVVTGAFALLTAQSLKNIDAIGKMSKTYGIATEDLAAFTVASSLGGASLDLFAKAGRNMAVATYDYVVRGTGAAVDAFKQLNITQEDLRPIMNDNVALFGLIGDKLNALDDGAIKTAVAVKVLGGRAVELLPALAGGSEQFEKYREEAQLLGVALSGDAVRGVEAANDSMTRLGFLFTGLRDQTTAALAPAIEGLTTDFREWVLEIAESEGGIKNFAQNSAISILEFAKDAIGGFESIIEGIESAKAQLEDWGLIEGDNSEKAILYQQGVIERLEESIAMYERLGNKGEQYTALLAAREEQQAKLNELTNGEVGLFDRAAEGIDKIIEKIRERQAAEAEGGTSTSTDTGGGDAPVVGGGDNSAYLDGLAQRYEALQNELASEKELADQHYEDQLFTIEEAFQEQLSSNDERYADLENAYADHQEKLTGLADKEAKARERVEERVANTITSLQRGVWSDVAGLLRDFAGDSEAAALAIIVIEKGLAIAQTIMNTQVAAMRALAELGPVLGPPAALEIESLGATSVGIIAATGLGDAYTALNPDVSTDSSSGGGSSGGGGGGNGGNQFAQDREQLTVSDQVNVVINMYGNNYGHDDFNAAVGDAFRAATRNDQVRVEYNGEPVTVS